MTAASLLSIALLSTPVAPARASLPESRTEALGFRGVSSERASMRRMRYQLAAAPTLQPMGGHYVGLLHEKWRFPSDHLPIGMTFDGLRIFSWNVLDAEYIDWVFRDSQGLNGSLITDEHVYFENSKLTVRDRHVVDKILEQLSSGYSRDVLSLQECSEAFLAELRARLPSDFELVSSYGEAIVFDKRRLELITAKSVAGIFADQPERTIQELALRRVDDGQTLRLINVHLPGDPDKPARVEFAQYLQRTFNADVTTIAMGDMNFNELEMKDALSKAFQTPPFSIYTPYCTNISPRTFVSKAIDHFIVYDANDTDSVILNTPVELMPELPAIVGLLEGREVVAV